MANTELINKVLCLNPNIELVVRKIYWRYINIFGNTKTKRKDIKSLNEKKNFQRILSHLNCLGIDKGSLLLVHSSFKALEGFKKEPLEIINALLETIGETGTLAMPAIRKYKEEPSRKDYLNKDLTGIMCTYDLKKTKIWTGLLPFYMMKMPQAVISRFPINSMVAVGALAKAMMEKNLDGDFPTPCGKNSSWKFCLDNDAFIIGLGIDLTHSLTMIHVAEDCKEDDWPIKNWYRERIFKIIDKDYEEIKKVKERFPAWGALHFAERTLCLDLIKSGLLRSEVIEGVLVETIKARDLIDFLNSKNGNGYPYFWVKKYLKNETSKR